MSYFCCLTLLLLKGHVPHPLQFVVLEWCACAIVLCRRFSMQRIIPDLLMLAVDQDCACCIICVRGVHDHANHAQLLPRHPEAVRAYSMKSSCAHECSACCRRAASCIDDLRPLQALWSHVYHFAKWLASSHAVQQQWSAYRPALHWDLKQSELRSSCLDVKVWYPLEGGRSREEPAADAHNRRLLSHAVQACPGGLPASQILLH